MSEQPQTFIDPEPKAAPPPPPPQAHTAPPEPAPAPASTAVVRSALSDKVRYAETLAYSGLLPEAYRGKAANVLYAVEFGESIGVPPIQAILGVHIIKGKPSASAALVAALVRRAGHRLRVTGNDESAVATIRRADDPEFEFRSEWTIDRARRAGLLELDKNGQEGTWHKFPAAMLKARATTEVARDACEEALNGLHYTPEELGAMVGQDGEPLEPQALPLPKPTELKIAHAKGYVFQQAGGVVDLAKEWWETFTAATDLDEAATPEKVIQVAELDAYLAPLIERAKAAEQDKADGIEDAEVVHEPEVSDPAPAPEPTPVSEGDTIIDLDPDTQEPLPPSTRTKGSKK